VRVEAPHRARRRLAAVEILDQPVRADHLAAMEQEDHEQALLFRAEHDLSAALGDLEWPQYTELHHSARHKRL
jgi:hypothetical protein